MCNVEIANMSFGFHYNLGVCHDPVSVSLSVDYSPQKFHADMGPYTASVHVGVPGLTVGVPSASAAAAAAALTLLLLLLPPPPR
jgi:hypothetical protein